MADASTSTYAVLGLLSLGPMSGYDAAQAAERSIAYFWPISKTHVYSELGRLEALGWAEPKEVRQTDAPNKRVFHITKAGERALDEWLVSGPLPDEVHRMPFLIKLFIGHRIPRADLRQMLEAFRQEAEDYRAVLGEVVDSLDGIPQTAFPRATALLGLRMTEGVLRWADEVEDMIPSRRYSIDPHSKTGKTKEIFEATPAVPSPSPSKAKKRKSGRDRI